MKADNRTQRAVKPSFSSAATGAPSTQPFGPRRLSLRDARSLGGRCGNCGRTGHWRDQCSFPARTREQRLEEEKKAFASANGPGVGASYFFAFNEPDSEGDDFGS